MKKLFTFLAMGLLIALSTNLTAQSQRMAVVEEATQASCGPCATYNPALQVLMNSNAENVIFLAYQVWWPGFDPMYLDNPEEVDKRVGNYYGYEFAPQAMIQGELAGGTGNLPAVTQALIDECNAQASEFDMELSASIINGELQVTGSINATMAANGNFKLRLMIAEDIIYYEDAPGGTNGETEYHHVFKGFIGGSAGIDIADAWEDGDSYIIDETYNISELNIYHYDGLEVMAIIQNDDNKYIHQGIKDHDIEITSEYENSAAPISISGLPNNVCVGEQTLSPTVKIANHGNIILTSATITYNINGEEDQVIEWTGSLETLASENVVLDPYTFTATADNIISVTISMPNGAEDENPADNNTVTTDLLAAPESGYMAEVEILTDNYGDETYWEIRNSVGDVLTWGGNPNVGIDNIGTGSFPPPFSEYSYGNNEQVSVFVEIPATDCYTFHITDFYGDGILGDGYYQLNDFEGNMIISEDNLTDEEMNNFSGEEALSIEELNISNFSIYPNPANEVAHIAMNMIEANSVTIEVVDLLGKVVYSEELGNLPAGNHLLDVDASFIGTGLYLFNIYVGTQKVTERVSISK